MGLGLQSFGEGIDLPRALCEHVVIDKLPFTPPNSPVEEALAEWLSGQQRDVRRDRAAARDDETGPMGGLRRAHAADLAVITVCDTRLVTMRYGRDILAGLPPP